MNMYFLSRRRACAAIVIAAVAFGSAAIAADTAKNSAATLNSDGQKALNSLYAKAPAAKAIGGKASAVLVFPKVTKAGLGIGGQYGEGVLLKGGKPVAYYNTAGVSTGLQAGAQTFGYAMFFMNDAALKALDKTEGFEVGVGPSVVVMDEGKAKNTTSTTAMNDDVYAFIFGQKGLMAGLGIQGNKISKINPK
ncbi:MAG TPA: lipid-binding SYLF domain-containing protein [Burkholderiaceae bacterium]|nr:lipid-binding SYLF domain-containing protein [Burkholderiaceae bacterium]